MNNWTDCIDKQIGLNRNKNILCENLDTFEFSHNTIKAISQIDSLHLDSKELLIDYAVDRAIEEFIRVNQYFSFDQNAIIDLRKIYTDLFESVMQTTQPIEKISNIHFKRLKFWLGQSNPFAEKIYNQADTKVTPVACSEYSPALQLDILRIDVEQLTPPVLDVGCGQEGSLVNYLNEYNIESFGIDRCKFSSVNLHTTDWLEYNYGIKKWGTIISNLGFSNHFIHHNLREDGKYIQYGRTYMRILNALKVGGKFFYAPDLSFIEKYLDVDQFSIEKHAVMNSDFKTTIISRLK
jgi:hypothetical protein